MGFTIGHPFYKGAEKGWFKSDQVPWNLGKQTIKKCEICGKEFTTNKGIMTKPHQKYCSIKCAGVGDRGEKHPFWNGGVKIQGGYSSIYQKPGEYHLEHRMIMEKSIGRKLEDSEIVHHINGDIEDNRIENLGLMTRGEHTSLHQPWKGHKKI